MKHKFIFLLSFLLFAIALTVNAQDNLLDIEDASPGISLEGRIPLLLIHGWNYNGKPSPPATGQWNNFLNYLLNDPELREFYKPYFVKYWSNSIPVNAIAGLLRDKIQQTGFHEKEIVIIAHSMGGLVSRSFMNEYSYTSGKNIGKKCGENVRLLITLGTPHHGSPMANGPARDNEVDFIMKLTLSTVESMAFKDIKYNEVNRSDLRWDNYDNLLNYDKYPGEKNDWLVNLNSNTIFDSKTICYSSTVKGIFKLPPLNTVKEQYQVGAYILEKSFGIQNDGIVPIASSSFAGHQPKLVRFFAEHNHAEINTGVEGSNELHDNLKLDLMDIAPPLITWPVVKNEYLKHSHYRNITWKCPSSIYQVNLWLSLDSGLTYNKIAENFNAQNMSYNWFIPDTNSTKCLVKISDALNDNNFSVSDNAFYIYHNKVAFENKTSKAYFAPEKTNSITWYQYGLSDKVKITYHDPKNNFEKVLSQEYPASNSYNSFSFYADSSFPPSDSAFISIQLLNLEKYYDYEVYTFKCQPFMFLGSPELKITSPSDYYTDIFGVSGEKLYIDSIYNIKWETEGEIKFVKISLCDSSKNIIKTISKKAHKPGFASKGNLNWKIPPYFGDKFYLFAEGGVSEQNITISEYSKYPLRINRQTQIISPNENETDISFFPCFELNNNPLASEYNFEIIDAESKGKEYYQNISSESNITCISGIENELLPGKEYSLTAQIISDTIKYYKTRLNFAVKKDKPDSFKIINPIKGAITQGNELKIEWNNAAGAYEYEIEIKNKGNIIFNNTYNKIDTSIIAKLGNPGIPDTLHLRVSATNNYGTTTTQSYFFKNNRTEVKTIFDGQVKMLIYSNKNTNKIIIDLFIPQENDNNIFGGAIYNLTGQKVFNINSQIFHPGNNKIQLEGILLKEGIYIGVIEINNQTIKQKFAVVN